MAKVTVKCFTRRDDSLEFVSSFDYTLEIAKMFEDSLLDDGFVRRDKSLAHRLVKYVDCRTHSFYVEYYFVIEL